MEPSSRKFVPLSLDSSAQRDLKTPGREVSDRGLGNSPVRFDNDADADFEDIASIS